MFFEKSKEAVFLAAVAFVLTGALWRAFSGNADPSLDGDTRTQVILAVMYGGVLLMAVMTLRWTAWLLAHSPALVGLLIVTLVSPVWAETPDLVFRRAISLLGTSLFGVVLAARLTAREQLRLTRGVLRLAAVACLVVFVIARNHAMATDYGTGSVRGIFPHKNVFGAAMALGLLAEWYATDNRWIGRTLKVGFLGLFAGLLALSQSITSIVTVGAALVLVWSFERLHQRYRIPLPAILFFLAGLVVCVALLGADTSIFTEMLGRSKDLTGRIDLWRSVGSMILARPFLGYGFSGFWSGASMESFTVEKYVGWSPTYSHNGYLEILLNVGAVGAGLFLIFLWKGMKRTIRSAEEGISNEDSWPLAFLIFFVVHNLAECTIIWQNCFEWSLCIATVISSDSTVKTVVGAARKLSEPISDGSELQYAFDAGSRPSLRSERSVPGEYANH